MNTTRTAKTQTHYLLLMMAGICLALCGCAFSSAQTTIDNTTFQGRYLFKSQGVNITASPPGPFFEAGIVYADGQGHYTVVSTENASGQLLHNVSPQPDGTYSLNSQGIGTMRTASDTSAFYISADGSHAYVVSTESFATWLVELTRE